jgi:hypothetical protein
MMPPDANAALLICPARKRIAWSWQFLSKSLC